MTGVFYTRKREKIFKRGIRLSSEIWKLDRRCQRYADYSGASLTTTITQILDNAVLPELNEGFFSWLVKTNQGFFALYGYLSVNATGIATQIGGDNCYTFYRNEGADAVLRKLGDGYKVGDWSMTNNGTHWTATYDTGHQVIWAGANDFQVAQAGQATGGGPTCSMTVTWSGTVITCATWGTNQGTTVTGKYIYQE